MSVSIKLSRIGAKNSPFFRIVAQTTRSKRDGKNHEILGWWNPKTNEKELDKKSFDKWISLGAKITSGVRKIL